MRKAKSDGGKGEACVSCHPLTGPRTHFGQSHSTETLDEERLVFASLSPCWKLIRTQSPGCTVCSALHSMYSKSRDAAASRILGDTQPAPHPLCCYLWTRSRCCNSESGDVCPEDPVVIGRQGHHDAEGWYRGCQHRESPGLTGTLTCTHQLREQGPSAVGRCLSSWARQPNAAAARRGTCASVRPPAFNLAAATLPLAQAPPR